MGRAYTASILSSSADPLDSLTGQPRSPSTEPPNQTLAEPTPPTGKSVAIDDRHLVLQQLLSVST